jgi:hypothetical protein
MASLRALSALPMSNKQAQESAVRAVAEQGLAGASGALNRIIRSSGLSPVAFGRALFWISTGPALQRVIIGDTGLIGYAGSTTFDVYRALAGDEPLDPMVASWWANEQIDQTPPTARVIVQRDMLQRYLRQGVWIRGRQSFQLAQTQLSANRLLDEISRGRLLMAISDREVGDINMLIKEDGDILIESIKYRAGESERPRLGLLIRDEAAAKTFAERFDAIWDEVPAEEKDPFRVNAWIREHMAGTRG